MKRPSKPSTPTGCSTHDPLQQTVERYLRLCGQRLRPSSLCIKRGSLLGFVRFLRAQYPHLRSWAHLQRVPHVEAWLNALHDSSLKANTRLLRIGDVDLFLDDLSRWQWPEAPPPGLLRPEDRPAQEHHLPKPFPHEVDQTVQHALRQEPTLAAMGLLLLRRTGMRIGEMRNLTRNALDASHPDRCTLHVPMGKTRTERALPLDAETAQLVQTIQRQRGSQLASQPIPEATDKYLMVDPQGRRLGRGRCSQTLKRVAQHFLPTEHVHPHRLRHTFATEMIRAGMSVQVLMKLLGHTNAAMTMRYVEVTAADLRRDYDKALQQLPALRRIPLPDPSASGATLTGLHDLFHLLITRLEALHRDTANPTTALSMRRFVKRLRRTRDDFLDLLEKAGGLSQ
jgi:site-specific recombinase XerD